MNPLKKKRGFVCVLSGVLVAFMFLLPSLQAADDSRLTEEDIVKMQEKIKANGWTFQVGLNSASDYSLDQLVAPSPVKSSHRNASAVSEITLENIDAIIAPPKYYACVCTPVENQGCCSSWAWASTDMFESVIKLKNGVTVDLSEQWLLDCNPYGWDCIDEWQFPTGNLLYWCNHFLPGPDVALLQKRVHGCTHQLHKICHHEIWLCRLYGLCGFLFPMLQRRRI